MSWQTGSINPATTSPATDITKITNDLSVLKSILTTGATDTDFSALKLGYSVTIDTAANALIQFNKSGVAGFSIKDDTTLRDLIFLSGGVSERLRLTAANGRLLIGTADDGVNKLQVSGGIACSGGVTADGATGFLSATFYSNAQNPIWRFGNALTSGLSYFQGSAGIGGADVFGFHFGTATAAGSKFSINSAGVAAAASGLKVGNAAVADSAMLDWYEEGTFTPTMLGASTAGTTTYVTQTGKYTRIGNVVYFNIVLNWTAATGTGVLRIGGLPFTSTADTTAAVYYNSLTTAAGADLVCKLTLGTGFAFLYTASSGAGSSAIGIDTAADMTITGHYFV